MGIMYKCNCQTPNTANWSVIRISGRDFVVRCSLCGQIWHTTASYAADLRQQEVTQFEWRQMIRTEKYHKGEDPFPMDAEGYLAPDFESIFEEEKNET